MHSHFRVSPEVPQWVQVWALTGINQAMHDAWFHLHKPLLNVAKLLIFNRPEDFTSHGLKVVHVPFGRFQTACIPFYFGMASIQSCYCKKPDQQSAALMVVFMSLMVIHTGHWVLWLSV